jgi:hypothetical protein
VESVLVRELRRSRKRGYFISQSAIGIQHFLHRLDYCVV